eukprot:TRINITY_DN4675_c0_g3_i1.p1 TRINITY_DN4675_c0_g3~~TRINITY_DN4675_c0_g3_i1.p1  ORF type:complete len:534 (+),score=40.16 TRINITY_DN4675_c0_g3_i1:246-1847(+)
MTADGTTSGLDGLKTQLLLPVDSLKKVDFGVEDKPNSTKTWVLNVVYFIHEGTRMLLLRFMTAYFTHAGLNTKTVGILQVVGTLSAFCGEYTWANVADKWLGFKTTVSCCNCFGIVFFLLLSMVPAENVPLIAVVYSLSSFGLSWVGIRDAFAVVSLEKQGGSPETGSKQFGRVRKFAAIGWGMTGLLTGCLQDAFGPQSVFGLFLLMQCVLMSTLLAFVVPMPVMSSVVTKSRRFGSSSMDIQKLANQAMSDNALKPRSIKDVLLTKHTMLFMLNIVLYGTFTALQEVYEFVYLLKGFKGTSNMLLGATLVVMTLSELPVFHYADKLIASGFVSVYTACQTLMAVRCVLYSWLPVDCPWMVLLIEPFHGVTFAAMWASSVEYARRESPYGCRSRMQAIVSGTYFQVSQALGSIFWGHVISEIGFRPSYQACAVALLVWSFLFNFVAYCLGDTPLSRRNEIRCSSCFDGALSPRRRAPKRLRTSSFYRRMTPGPIAPLEEESPQNSPYSSPRWRSKGSASRLAAVLDEGDQGA